LTTPLPLPGCKADQEEGNSVVQDKTPDTELETGREVLIAFAMPKGVAAQSRRGLLPPGCAH
jgi:hypothetical protein